jgi:hypothetical protein
MTSGKIQRKLPNPIPRGENAQAFFTREYQKLADDPNAYGWFQLQMVILAFEEKPALSLQKLSLTSGGSGSIRDG